MTRAEAIFELLKNPKGQIIKKVDDGGYTYIVEMPVYKLNGSKIANLKTNSTLPLFIQNDKSEWEFIPAEKKLREFDFWEMYYERYIRDKKYAECKSVLTKLDFYRANMKITKEEFQGKWTIDGVFEDESEEI